MFKYPATVSFDDDAEQYEITFRDFDTIPSVALAEEDIELEACEGLTAIIGEMIDSRIPLPEPSVAQADDILVHLPVLSCLKAALHNAMIGTGTRKADLARKLNLNGAQIDRLLDVSYASKVEMLEQALYLVGYEVSVALTPLK